MKSPLRMYRGLIGVGLLTSVGHGQPGGLQQPHFPCCGPGEVSLRGPDSAGQAGRIATDDFGNVAVVSGPSAGL